MPLDRDSLDRQFDEVSAILDEMEDLINELIEDDAAEPALPSSKNEELILTDKKDQDSNDSALDKSDKHQLHSEISLAFNKAVKNEKSLETIFTSQVIIYASLKLFLYGFVMLSSICVFSCAEIFRLKRRTRKHMLELKILKEQMKLLKPKPLEDRSEEDGLPDYNAL